MGLVSVAKGTQVTIISTEHSLTQQTGIGIYVLVVDSSEMLAGDILTLRIKTKSQTGASSKTAYEIVHADAQAAPNKYSVPVPVDTEIICTLTQTAGTARSFPWNLLRA